MFIFNLKRFLVIFGLSSNKTSFNNIGFAKISPKIVNKKNFFEKISYKNKKDSLKKDRNVLEQK